MEPLPYAPARRFDASVATAGAGGLAGLAGLSAAIAGARPLADAGPSVIVSYLVGAAVAVALARAPRWTWPVAAAGTAFLAQGAWLIVGVVTLVAALALIRLWSDPADPRTSDVSLVAGAGVGLGVVTVAFRLPADDLPFLVPTLVAAIAIAPAVLTATRTLGDRTRLWGRRIALGLAAAIVVFSGLAGVSALMAKADVDDAIDASREALDLIRDDDRPAAVGQFSEAAAGFGDAADAVSAPWLAPARLVPVVGQHLDAIDRMASAGATLATTSADTIAELDLDNLTFSGGRVDLARITALEAPAGDLVDAATGARTAVDDASTPWLVPLVADKIDELSVELDDAVVTGQSTVEAIEAAPWLLGAEAPRRYLVWFTSPAESRELGGLMGGYGVLTADDGALDFDNRGSAQILSESVFSTLDPPPEPPVDVRLPGAYLLQQPLVEARNWTGTADFPTAAATARASMAAIGETFDGVIMADSYTLAAFMQFTGPVTIPEVDRTIDPDEAIDYLLRDQYLEFDEADQDVRKELLGELGGEVFGQLTDGALPSPPELASALGPLVSERRLLAVVDDPGATKLFDRVGLSGRFGANAGPGAAPGVETVHVTSTNLRPSKIDAYVERTVQVGVTVESDGSVAGSIRIIVENQLPDEDLGQYVLVGDEDPQPDGLPARTHFLFLGVYSSLELTGATVDGEEISLVGEDAYGLRRYAVPLTIDDGQLRTVELTIADVVDPGNFDVRLVPFASANRDSETVAVAGP